MPDNTNGSDKDALLAALQAHGQNFLASFDTSDVTQSKRKRRKLDLGSESERPTQRSSGSDANEADEWHGFGSENDSQSVSDNSEADDSEDDFGNEEFRSDAPAFNGPQVVTFSDNSFERNNTTPKHLLKSFMSSKISKLKEEYGKAAELHGEFDEEAFEEERSNIRNDAMLQNLIHTQLLARPSTSDMNLSPAERRRALEGRVMELASGAKLGKGESRVRQLERSKASKNVRFGLERKIGERKHKALEEAKELGNYHHSIKHLFETTKKQPDRRKRDRGLKAGVGRLRSGTLHLGRGDVASVMNTRGTGRGRGNRKR